MIENRDSGELYLEENENSTWIVTYADLMTLLLVFFVLLYSISSLNLEKFKHAITSRSVSDSVFVRLRLEGGAVGYGGGDDPDLCGAAL